MHSNNSLEPNIWVTAEYDLLMAIEIQMIKYQFADLSFDKIKHGPGLEPMFYHSKATHTVNHRNALDNKGVNVGIVGTIGREMAQLRRCCFLCPELP